MFRSISRRISALFRINRLENDMQRELKFHLEREIEENLRRGLTRDEARRRAIVSFGGVEQLKEQCRDVQRSRVVENMWHDARYAARLLFRNKGFTVIAVMTLALGIGANTAIFSVIYGVLLRPLPYENGDRLAVLRQQAPRAGVNNLGFSVKEIEDYRQKNGTLTDVVEHHSMNFILYGGPEPERIQTGVVSASFFDVMGVNPILGRTFLESDERHGAEAVLILSNEYWKRSHNGDPTIVGRVFRMNNRPHTVIGVLPPIPQYPNDNDVYMPISACPTRSSEQFIANRNARMMSAFGRLKPGVSEEQVQADLSVLAGQLQQAYPDSYPINRGYAAEVRMLKSELTRRARPTFLVLLGTAGLVLLIACFNVANLTLARLMRRERELALRTALGATRMRLLRQLLTESALLALIGGGIGVFVARAGLNLLVSFAARFTPRAGEIKLDAAVLLFTLIVSLATGLAFGLLPALAERENLVTSLKEGSGQSTGSGLRQRIRAALVIAQVAISFVLLIGAGLMVRSLIKLQQVDPGFKPEQVLVVRVMPNWSKYTTTDQYRNFALRTIERVRQQAGVLSAAIASTYPLNPAGIANGPFNRNFTIEGRDVAESELAPQADFRVVSPEYFDTIRLPIVRGRFFTEFDSDKSEAVAVINQSLARHRWGTEDPIGKRISFDRGQNWIQVVGVVGDTRQYGLEREPLDEIYRPVAQQGGGSFVLARTAATPSTVIQQMRQAIHEVDSETAIDHVRTLSEAHHEALASPRLTTILLALFGALALVITAAGIAGVMALTVIQRTQELGIRMALGATQGAVQRMVVGQGMRLVVIGLVLGVAIALAGTRLMTTLLYGVTPSDPLTFASVALLLATAAAVTCYIPARRVTSIDPMLALRSE
jgi:predicted permease